MNSDKKDAVQIGVTLSTQLINASLAMIAVVGTFAAFVIDKRIVGCVYYLVVGGAFISFVASIFCGGIGINIARRKGYEGAWCLEFTGREFNYQAIFCLIGIILFSVSVFLGREKNNELLDKIEKQEQQIKELYKKDSLKEVEIEKINIKLDSVQRAKINQLSDSNLYKLTS